MSKKNKNQKPERRQISIYLHPRVLDWIDREAAEKALQRGAVVDNLIWPILAAETRGETHNTQPA